MSIAQTNISAQSYETLWNEVRSAAKKDLPKSAMKSCEQILQKARAEGNTGQMLKAFFQKAEFEEQVSPDSTYKNIKLLEEMAAAGKDDAEKMFIHSLIAGQYATYASANSWALKRRGNIAADNKEETDIKEWSADMFYSKVLEEVHLSLGDMELLKKTGSGRFAPMVEKNRTSGYFGHDLLHLLGRQALASLSMIAAVATDPNELASVRLSIYDEIINIYKSAGDKDAALLLGLERLQFIYNETGDARAYEKGIDGLISGTDGENELLCELLLAKANILKARKEYTAAVGLCTTAIDKFPKYYRIAALKNLKETLLAQSIEFIFPDSAYPGEVRKIDVSNRNITDFDIVLYEVPGSLRHKQTLTAKELASCKLFSTSHFKLDQTPDLKAKEKEIEFTMPGLGCYAVTIKANGKERFETFLRVSRLSILTINSEEEVEAIVVDRESGNPVSGSTVTLYDRYNSNRGVVLESKTTDERGRATFSKKKIKHNYSIHISAAKGTDTHLGSRYLSLYNRAYYNSGSDTASHTVTKLFTDRSIYRPGQKVYVSGLTYTRTGDETKAASGSKINISMRDANFREIGSRECISNEMGSFSTSFTIPESGMNGSYSLRCDGYTAAFTVEEYKRPTFEILTEDITKTFKLGDTVTVKGTAKSFAGAPLSGATGRFRIEVSQWLWWRAVNHRIIKNGTVTLDADGRFEIPVSLDADVFKVRLDRFDYAGVYQDEEDSMDEDESDTANDYYTFTVTLDVTNGAGETQSADAVVAAGNKPMLLSYSGEYLIDKKKKFEFTIDSYNPLHKPVDCKVDYSVRALGASEGTEALLKGEVMSNVKASVDLGGLDSGKYEILYSAKAADGTPCEGRTTVTVFSTEDTKPVAGTTLWVYKDGDRVYFGTSEKNATIFVDKFTGKNRESKNIPISDSIRYLDFPYMEEYGNGAAINFCIVNKGKMIQQRVESTKPLPDKLLKLRWSVFRDKLTPGQKEEWKLSVTYPDGRPADAELLAFMYDASLDKISRHSLDFGISFNRIISSASWDYNRFTGTTISYHSNPKWHEYKGFTYDNIQHATELLYGSSLRGRLYGYRTALNEAVVLDAAMPRAMETKSSVKFKEFSAAEEETAADEITTEGTGAGEKKLTARSNFAETAFFYPQLRADSCGNVSIEFTLPESLTRWQFRGLAHTRDMSYGTLDAVTVAQIEFMLQPGDKTDYAAQIVNLSDKQIDAEVSFELFDPATEKVFEKQTRKIAVAAGGNASVSFGYNIDGRYDVIGLRMIADGGEFSDGEQHLVAVQSAKVPLVQSGALPVRGNQSKEFSLKQLFNRRSKSATDKKLTVEFSGNPVWYAVQALPTLAEPGNDCAISWSNAFYAGEIASHIANSSPKIKNVLESWKKSEAGKESLTSSLQKNQELKNILLGETPWVLEAKDEAEQKERISSLFEPDNITAIRKNSIEKLSRLQGDDGGWSWFKGMEGSPWMTAYILLQNIRLQLLTGNALPAEASKMHEKGMAFMHRAAKKHYDSIMEMARKYNRKDTGVDFFTLNYLYIIALDAELKGVSGKGAEALVPREYRKMYGYFLSKVNEEPKSQDIQKKAMAAVILDAAGRTKEAGECISSIKEHLTTTEELGSFFDFKENPWGFGQMALNAQVAAIEAFDKVAHDTATVDEMNIWLLKQKQTQAWKSSAMTADAVYALLQRGSG